MVMTPSTMLALGTKAPDFDLPDVHGNSVSLSDFSNAKAVVVMFICNHCPYVIHVAPTISALAKKYQPLGIQFVAISSNDVEAYPQDRLEKMAEEASLRDYTFPYLYDESQDVAKSYTAACTPDIFVFDEQHSLVYRGQIDSSRPHRISSGNYDSTKNPANGEDLSQALDALLAGDEVSDKQRPSLGCNIKWKPGNEPNY